MRIDISYGSQNFSTSSRTVSELQSEIREAADAGGGWIEVNFGDGGPTKAFLFIGPGTPIAVIPAPAA